LLEKLSAKAVNEALARAKSAASGWSATDADPYSHSGNQGKLLHHRFRWQNSPLGCGTGKRSLPVPVRE